MRPSCLCGSPPTSFRKNGQLRSSALCRPSPASGTPSTPSSLTPAPAPARWSMDAADAPVVVFLRLPSMDARRPDARLKLAPRLWQSKWASARLRSRSSAGSGSDGSRLRASADSLRPPGFHLRNSELSWFAPPLVLPATAALALPPVAPLALGSLLQPLPRSLSSRRRWNFVLRRGLDPSSSAPCARVFEAFWTAGAGSRRPRRNSWMLAGPGLHVQHQNAVKLTYSS